MGVMSVVTRGTDPFDERNIQLLTAVGTWAGLAIENARLHANARRLAVLEERDRIRYGLARRHHSVHLWCWFWHLKMHSLH